jgi:hypothetical protein
MKKITNQDVIENLRKLPEQQKINIAAQANLRGLNIEKDIVPVIVSITNVYGEIAEKVADNYKLLLGENYKFLNK